MNATPEQRAAASADTVIDAARTLAQSWERVAAFLTDNPDITQIAPRTYEDHVLVFTGREPDPVDAIADIARRAAEAGARVEEYVGTSYAGVKVFFGPVYLDVYAEREQVCAPVTVGVVPDVRYKLTVALDGITGQGEPEGIETGGAQ